MKKLLMRKSVLACLICLSMLTTLLIWVLAPRSPQAQPINAFEMVKLMGRGINLGNTFEGKWSNLKDYDTVKKVVDVYIESGYTNIRIPVTWGSTKNGTPVKSDEAGNIDFNHEEVKALKKLVDYVLLDVNKQREVQGKSPIILIIDTHHEAWTYNDVIGTENYEKNMKRLESIWNGICTLFKDAPNTLIFEFFNEPQGKLDSGSEAKTTVIDMNNKIYSWIRNFTVKGKKVHETRNLAFGGHNYNSSFGLRDAYKKIEDVPGKGTDTYVIGTYHSYFKNLTDNFNRIDAVREEFSKKLNIPVYLGEFGLAHKGNITQETVDHYRQIADYAIKNGYAISVWDDNGWFQIYDRTAGTFNALNDAVLGKSGNGSVSTNTPEPTNTPTPSSAPVTTITAGGNVKVAVVIDGQALQFDPEPVIVNGRVLVPMRAIFEVLGAKVQWVEATSTVTATKEDTQILLKIGSTKANINDREINLDVPAQLIDGKEMVPLNFVSEAFGSKVIWDEATNTATITSKKESNASDTN